MPLPLPPLASMARRALPTLLEGTIGPIVAFYLGYAAGGLVPGLALAGAWSVGAVALRVSRGQRVSGLLVLSLVALAVRTVTSLATGSVFVYFLQPTLGTFATALAFAGSAVLRRPLTERLSADLVELPESVTTHPAMGRFHVTISLLWGLTFAASGALGLWLLTSQSVGTFLLARTAASGGLTVLAIGLSVLLFWDLVRRHDLGATPVPS